MSPRATLKRSLTLPVITLYGLGTTVGAGIYVLVGKVAGHAGFYAPLSFLIAALLAGVTALAFTELSARFPKSAGEALYVREGFRSPSLALVVGLLVVTAGTVSAAAISIGSAGYLMVFLPYPKAAVVTALVLLLSAVAIWGILESALTASLFTLVEVGGLLLVIWSGAGAVPDLPIEAKDIALPRDTAVLGGIFAGALLAFYAFIGFEDMVNVAEEVTEVTRTLPLAIVLTLVLTAVLYLALSTVAVLAVPPAELAASEAPLALIYERSGGRWPEVITTVGIVATLNGALVQIIMASRVLYGLAMQDALPSALARVHPRTRTPVVATLLVTAAILGLALWLPIEVLAEITSVVTLFIFLLVNLALILIKRRGPQPAGIWSVPRAVPVAGVLASGAFLLFAALRLISNA